MFDVLFSYSLLFDVLVLAVSCCIHATWLYTFSFSLAVHSRHPFHISMALQEPEIEKGKQDKGEWQIPEARIQRAAATSARRKQREAASKKNTAATEASKAAAAAEPEAAEEAVATEAAAATAEAAAATAKTAGKDMKYDLQEMKMLEMEHELQVMKCHLNNLQDEVNGLRRTCDLLWLEEKCPGLPLVHQSL